MAVSVVTVTLSDTLGGTTDIEVAGFGAPSAAIVIVTQAAPFPGANPTPTSVVSIGFWDGTSQSVSSTTSVDALGITGTRKVSRTNYIAVGANTASPNWFFGYSCSARPNGIRLTLDIDNTSITRYCTVILINNVPAKLLTFTPNTTVDATQISSSLGFAPKALIATSVGVAGQTGSSGSAQSANAMLSFGAALSNGTQRTVSWFSNNGLDVSAVTELFSDNSVSGEISASAITWKAEVTAWGSDTFTVTTRTGSPGSDDIYILALGGDAWLDLNTITTSTVIGAVDTTTAYTPSALLLVGAGSNVTNTLVNDTRASTFSVGAADSTNNHGYALVDTDAAGTSNTESAYSSSSALYLRAPVGALISNLVLASATLGASKFTLDYTTVSASARKGWWLALAADPAVDVNVSVTGVQVIGTVGTAVVSIPVTVSLLGVGATGVIGTAISLIVTIAGVLGVQATGALGAVTVVGDAVVSLTGVQVTGVIGAATSSVSIFAGVLGVEATTAIGGVTVTIGVTVTPAGVVGYGLIGPVNVWGLVDDSQSPGWNMVPDTQTPAWGVVPTSQTPNWQQIVS